MDIDLRIYKGEERATFEEMPAQMAMFVQICMCKFVFAH
jgi:hypothetical protein